MRMSLYGTYVDLSKLSTITEEEHVEFSVKNHAILFILCALLSSGSSRTRHWRAVAATRYLQQIISIHVWMERA